MNKDPKSKVKIEVFSDTNYTSTIAEFGSIEELLKWNQTHKVGVDRIAINGCKLKRWSEIYNYV